MTRPDEIAALVDAIKLYRSESNTPVYTGPMVANILQMWTDRLSATSPGDTVRGAKLMSAGLDKALEALDAISANHIPDCPPHYTGDELAWAQRYVADLRRKAELMANGIRAALATAEKAGAIGYVSQQTIDECAEGRGGHIAGSPAFDTTIPLYTTPTPPSADVIAQLLSALKVLFADIERQPLATGDLHEHDVARRERSRAAIKRAEEYIQSAAPGGGTKSDGGVEGHARARVDGAASEKGCISRSGGFTESHDGLLNSPQPEAGIKPGPSDPAQEPEATRAQVNSACLSYRHDFGLLAPDRQGDLQNEAREWLRAWQREGFCYTRPVSLDREAIEQIIDPTASGDYRRSERQHKAEKILALIEGRT